MTYLKLIGSICLLFVLSLSVRGQSDFAHPLDPLNADEINTVVQTLRTANRVTDNSRFTTLTLREPPKAEVNSFRPGMTFPREAFVVVLERKPHRVFEAVVDIRAKNVISWKEVKGVQPTLTREDSAIAYQILASDPGWTAALRRRGITDLSQVDNDNWSAGWFGFADESKLRMLRAVPYLRGSNKNVYAYPIEGLVAYIDLTNKRVHKIFDHAVIPVPKGNGELNPESHGPVRASPKPLQISQPAGPEFEQRGNEISWQKWRFRYALHRREGVVLYCVGFEDQGKVRSILYRGSLSEMVVPYGDVAPGWFIRNPFDEGEYDIGSVAMDLETGTDVPENAVLVSPTISNEFGKPITRDKSVAIYERDGGVLWKHADTSSKTNHSRRARQLVVSYFANLGNYDYGFNWVFHQDGTLEMEVLLTGVMAVKAVVPEAGSTHYHTRPYGHLVTPELEAVHHQHIFNFRLDLDVDGSASNSVIEENTMALPAGRDNPYNNTFTMKETVLRRESQAKRQLNLASNRRWKVVNSNVRNHVGQPTGFLLGTGENSISYTGVASFVRKRAGFVNHHVWVTPHAPDEMNAAGFYINQGRGGDGLPKWTLANRPIENTDVVLWYTMGVTHLPRPEDWPVMPVHKATFKLVPVGFFDRNPTMDLPR